MRPCSGVLRWRPAPGLDGLSLPALLLATLVSPVEPCAHQHVDDRVTPGKSHHEAGDDRSHGDADHGESDDAEQDVHHGIAKARVKDHHEDRRREGEQAPVPGSPAGQ